MKESNEYDLAQNKKFIFPEASSCHFSRNFFGGMFSFLEIISEQEKKLFENVVKDHTNNKVSNFACVGFLVKRFDSKLL